MYIYIGTMYVYWYNVCILVQCKNIGTINVFWPFDQSHSYNVCMLVQCKYIGTNVYWPFDQSHSFVGIHVKHLFSFALSSVLPYLNTMLL